MQQLKFTMKKAINAVNDLVSQMCTCTCIQTPESPDSPEDSYKDTVIHVAYIIIQATRYIYSREQSRDKKHVDIQ